jgi:predicted transcriptional regulator
MMGVKMAVNDYSEQFEALLTFFKALSDSTRLKIVGLLAQKEYTVEEIAAILDLRSSTISHHLGRLADAGLVSARAESYYNTYRLETGALEKMARQLLAEETLPAVAADMDLDAYDRQVIKNYANADGSLKQIPTKQKKFEAILRYIAPVFEAGRRYSEREVNEILARYHEDTAILRRGLVDHHLMDREKDGTTYWLAGE